MVGWMGARKHPEILYGPTKRPSTTMTVCRRLVNMRVRISRATGSESGALTVSFDRPWQRYVPRKASKSRTSSSWSVSSRPAGMGEICDG